MSSYSRYARSRSQDAASPAPTRGGGLVFYPVAGLVVGFALMSFILGIAHGQTGWDDSERGALVYFMTTIVAVALIVPAMRVEIDSSMRLFARCCCFAVVALAVLNGTGLFDPTVPLQYVVDHAIQPLRQRYNV